jgi:hypothetical protein
LNYRTKSFQVNIQSPGLIITFAMSLYRCVCGIDKLFAINE